MIRSPQSVLVVLFMIGIGIGYIGMDLYFYAAEETPVLAPEEYYLTDEDGVYITTIDTIKPADTVLFIDPHDQSIITVDLRTGNVTYGEGVTLDEVSLQFWESLSRSHDRFCLEYCGCQQVPGGEWEDEP